MKETKINAEELANMTWQGVKFIFGLLITFLSTFLNLIIIGGSIVSFTLLYKLFPETFTKFIVIISPGIFLLFDIFYFIFQLGVALVIVYLVFITIGNIIEIMKASKERVKKRRKKFLEDLSDDIIKKMNKKKK